jgi:hypothetical protein
VDSRTDGRPRRTGDDKADVKNMLIREMKGSKAFSESLSEYQLKFQRRNRMDLILIIIVLLLIFGGGFGYTRWGYGGGIGIGGILLIVLLVYLLVGRGRF